MDSWSPVVTASNNPIEQSAYGMLYVTLRKNISNRCRVKSRNSCLEVRTEFIWFQRAEADLKRLTDKGTILYEL